MRVFVLSAWIYTERIQDVCNEAAIDVAITRLSPDSPGKYESDIAKQIAEFVIGVVDPWMFVPYVNSEFCKNIKWICSTYAGVDDVIKAFSPTAGNPSFALTRLGGVYGIHMAEYVIGHIIALERNFQQSNQDQCQQFWNEKMRLTYRLLCDLTIGILGVGDIGCRVAQACKAFGMRVHGLARTILPANNRSPDVDEYFQRDQLPAFLQSIDYVCNLLPATPETDSLLSGEMFRHCSGRSSVFINVGRGNICSEKDIVDALDRGHLSHAILDVYPTEPLSNKSPLWLHSKVTCTPHHSCIASPTAVARHFLENLKRFIEKAPLKHQMYFP